MKDVSMHARRVWQLRGCLRAWNTHTNMRQAHAGMRSVGFSLVIGAGWSRTNCGQEGRTRTSRPTMQLHH